MKRLAALLLVGVGSLLCRTSPAEASTILFSNLGPGDTFMTNIAWTIQGPTAFPPQPDFDQGSPFVPSQTSTLESIEAALFLASGPNVMELWLMSDVGGAPGSILESFSLTGLPPVASSSLVVATSVLHPLLLAGTQYWVIASASTDTSGGFDFNNTGDQGHAVRVNGGSWTVDTDTAAAFRVNGADPIPEPTSVLLLGTGLAAVIGRALARQRRK